MLGKLIKYDFKATSRTMFPIFITMIGLTFVCSLMSRLRLTKGFVFIALTIILTILLTCSFLITIFFTVNRFVNSLLKNEGYFSFALPVSTLTHIASKVINVIIWAVLELLCVFVCIMIMGLIGSSVNEIKEAFEELMHLDINFWGLLIELMIFGTLELIATTCLFFAAYAVAHLFGKHQTMIAIIFIIVMIAIRAFFFPSRIFISDYTDFFALSISWYIKPIIFAGLYCALTWFILDKRLNLE